MNETAVVESKVKTLPPSEITQSVGVDVTMCDSEGCKKIATHTYNWDWGQQGICCAEHQTIHTQLAGTLKRGVNFAVINPNASVPLVRDERIRFRAQVMTLEEEIKEVRIRAQEMYKSNQKLVGQVQRLSLVEKELKAQVKDATETELGAMQKLEERETQLAEASEELSRLRMIVDHRE